MPRFSVITPVYNRSDEVRDLLTSLAAQTNKDFEVIIVEDGSTLPCKDVVDDFVDKLEIQYFHKSNEGRSIARNFGIEHAKFRLFRVF
jgi:glycosyltransferase involved in cell wall biosynthesis